MDLLLGAVIRPADADGSDWERLSVSAGRRLTQSEGLSARTGVESDSPSSLAVI